VTYTVCEPDGTVITITSELTIALREEPRKGRYITREDEAGAVDETHKGNGQEWRRA
jgi:hypothetical protein